MSNEYQGDATRVFRHHLQPERSESLDIGTAQRRFNTVRAATATVDTVNATTATVTTLNATSIAAGGAVSGSRSVSIDSATSGSATAYTAAQSGLVTVATGASGTRTFTLPAAAAAPGAVFTFICGNAGGEILINPVASDKIVSMTWAAVGDASTCATAQISNTTTGIKNTAAANVVGDCITLVSDGVLTWFGAGMPTGVWASQ